MNKPTLILGRLGAVLSFSFCLFGGAWLLKACSLDHKDDALSIAIGFYFVGKAFFVGPMLWLVAGKAAARKDAE